jgi:hypothetical protein
MVRVIDNLGGVATDNADITVGTGCGQAPYLGSPFAFPTRSEAEDYDAGGEGVAYHDVDPTNNGGQYRPSEGVDVEACSDVGGGFDAGWLRLGEYIEYTVDVPTAGTYTIDTRVASLSAGGTFYLAFNGTNQTGTVNVPPTGGWQVWTTVSANATLGAGVQTMRFVPTGGEFNVNYFDISIVPTAVLPGGGLSRPLLYPAYPNPFGPSTTIRSRWAKHRTSTSRCLMCVAAACVRSSRVAQRPRANTSASGTAGTSQVAQSRRACTSTG